MREFSRQYLKILKTDFSGLNLTKILQEEEFYQKQIADGLLLLEALPEIKEKILETGLLIDVGFGGGFPILPLAKALPEVRFLGLEARKKKVEAVRSIARQLALSNVALVHKRFEEVEFDRECVVTFRAFGQIEECLEKIRATAPVTAVFYKGPNFDQLEGVKTPPAGVELKYSASAELEGTHGRQFLAYQWKGENVPCRTQATKKNLANLSQLIGQFF